jgi:hypothetical protein
MKKVFNWLIDKWLAGFVTASFFYLVKLYNDLPEDSKSSFFNFSWVEDLLNEKVQLSTMLIVVLIVVFITRIEKALLKAKYNSEDDLYEEPKNSFEKYRKDVFGVNNTIWTWKYEWRPFEQKFVIVDLKPNCYNCNTPMEYRSFYGSHSATCHKCRLEGKISDFQIRENINDVEKEIIRRIQDNQMAIADN